MGIAVLLHVIAIMIWIGGMFFAYMALRPVAASQLEPPVRLALWTGVFGKFFPWVWGSIAVILASGFWIIFGVYSGFQGLGMHIHIMLGLGILMMLIFSYVFFVPYRRLKVAVAAQDWPTGGANLAQIRVLVATNTLLGLVTTAVGAGGRYLF